jgi:putative transposase
MLSTVTLKVKLVVKGQDATALDVTRAAYVEALNETSKVAFQQGVNNPVTLHHLTYQTMRELTGLPANLVCSARTVVAEAYKREPKPKKSHHWKESAGVRFDARTLTLKIGERKATLTTTRGRIKVGLVFGDYHLQYLDGSWKIAGTATLVKQKRDWYLCLVGNKQITDASGSETIGVDSGIKRVATVNTGKVFKGGSITQLRRRRFKQRRSLKAGHNRSRNKRRLLKRLAQREQKAVAWKLWNVAGGIVQEAVEANASTIAVEDLKGIRERIRVAKKQRIIHHGWPFSSLFAKIRHVASKHGIAVEEVEARNTSRTCNKCGHCEKANRKSQTEFRCVACGHRLNADLMASHNIADRCVSQRCATRNFALKSVPRGTGLKTPALAGG